MFKRGMIAMAAACVIGLVGATQAKADGHGYWGGGGHHGGHYGHHHGHYQHGYGHHHGYYHHGDYHHHHHGHYHSYSRPYCAPPTYYGRGAAFYYGNRGGGLYFGF